jgi:ribosome recycling factor
MQTFKVTANHYIGGKSIEIFENNLLFIKEIEVEEKTNGRVVKVKKSLTDSNCQFLKMEDGKLVKMVNGKLKEVAGELIKDFEVSKNDKRVNVKHVRIFNPKVIHKGESVTISAECSPSAKAIEEAFKNQLGRVVKGCLSTDFFTIKKT